LRLLLELAPRDWYQLIWALQASVALDRREMARMLAGHAAKPTMLQPALHEAIQLQRDSELIDIVLGEKDGPDCTLPVRTKALGEAVRHGQRATAELLRRRGANDSGVSLVDQVIGAC